MLSIIFIHLFLRCVYFERKGVEGRDDGRWNGCFLADDNDNAEQRQGSIGRQFRNYVGLKGGINESHCSYTITEEKKGRQCDCHSLRGEEKHPDVFFEQNNVIDTMLSLCSQLRSLLTPTVDTGHGCIYIYNAQLSLSSFLSLHPISPTLNHNHNQHPNPTTSEQNKPQTKTSPPNKINSNQTKLQLQTHRTWIFTAPLPATTSTTMTTTPPLTLAATTAPVAAAHHAVRFIVIPLLADRPMDMAPMRIHTRRVTKVMTATLTCAISIIIMMDTRAVNVARTFSAQTTT